MTQNDQKSATRYVKPVLLAIFGLCVTAIMLMIAANSFTAFKFGANSWQGTPSHKFTFGLGINTNVGEEELGLPIYPGATPHKGSNADGADDADDVGANIWAVAANAGLRVATKTFVSDDPPEKVLAFYRQALSKYGSILTCSGQGPDYAFNTDKSDRLNCDGDDTGNDNIELKAGTQHNQHIVAVKPLGEKGASIFTLVFIHIGKTE